MKEDRMKKLSENPSDLVDYSLPTRALGHGMKHELSLEVHTHEHKDDIGWQEMLEVWGKNPCKPKDDGMTVLQLFKRGRDDFDILVNYAPTPLNVTRRKGVWTCRHRYDLEINAMSPELAVAVWAVFLEALNLGALPHIKEELSK
jgi:hypothetical protein